MINNIELERLALSWFQDNGYAYLDGKDIDPENENAMRTSFKEVILEKELLHALKRLNPNIPAIKLEDVVKELKGAAAGALIQQNKTFHYDLLRGKQIEVDRNGVKDIEVVFLIDFQNPERNSFLVVNQFSVLGARHTCRPDLIVFINGLPLAILELKDPSVEDTDLWGAYNQLQTYKEEIPDLFKYNEVLVVSNGTTARIGSITSNKERFLPWRTIANETDRPLLPYQLEIVIKGFFRQDLFLDYLRHFILYEQDGDFLIKKIAGYHQFHAVRNAVQATIVAADLQSPHIVAEPRTYYNTRVQAGSKKAGVVWHTQGSGKSISMVFYAGKLMQQPEMQNPTIVVVTDRADLDKQLFKTFSQSAELLRETPVQAMTRIELRDMLATRQSGGILFAMIQKFGSQELSGALPSLTGRSNVVVISDEAHRSQYGDRARLDRETGEYKFGYSKNLRDALPNATFIGFTGTPISQGDKDTRAVFGELVSIYDIQDAVDDGATVPIYYESRLARLNINRKEIDQLNQEVEEIIEEGEDAALRENTRSKWTSLEKFVGAKPRLKEVAKDIVDHFQGRINLLPGKGMIVCMSREICVRLYNELVALRADWHSEDASRGFIKVIMTGSPLDSDLLKPHVYTTGTRKTLEKRFKDPEDELKLVIVRDMWLTGFDAPACHTMYIDKPMRGHTLMQAIARVNGVFKDKPGGLVVDYIGIAYELREALSAYTESKGKGSPTLRADEALEMLLRNLDSVRGLLHGFDYSNYKTESLKLLLPAADFILSERENGKRRFLDLMAAVNKAYSLCSTLDEVQELKLEIAFFNAIKTAFMKNMNVDQKRLNENNNSLLKQILNNAVIPEDVDDVFQLAGLEKPDIGILSPEFLEEVRHLPQQNLVVELLERLLKDEIKAKTRGNIVQEKRFNERLMDTLHRYNNKVIGTAHVIEMLIEMHREFVEAMKKEDDLGLTQDEIRFYFALAENNKGENALADERLKEIAVELTVRLNESKTVDWQVRESVKAKIRNIVRRLLRRYGYPPDFSQEAIDLVLKQATALADMWTEQGAENGL